MFSKVTTIIGVVLAACAAVQGVSSEYSCSPVTTTISLPAFTVTKYSVVTADPTAAGHGKRRDEYHPRGLVARQNSGASTVTVTSTVMSTVATSTVTATTTVTNETTARASSTMTVTSTVTGNAAMRTSTVTTTTTSMATRRVSAATATTTMTTTMASSTAT